MINFVRSGNVISFNINLPKFLFKKKHFIFNQYMITYLRPNGQYITQIRENLPRVVEFNQYETHSYSDYIGCFNGLGWKITSIKILECKYRS